MKIRRPIVYIIVVTVILNICSFNIGFAEESNTISLGVYTSEGTLFESNTVEYNEGDTPYAVMSRNIGNVKKTGSGSSIYVSGIGGYRELAQGPLSGWVYAVNGVKPGGTAANAYNLSTGDKVVWYYSANPNEEYSNGVNLLDSYVANNPVVEKSEIVQPKESNQQGTSGEKKSETHTQEQNIVEEEKSSNIKEENKEDGNTSNDEEKKSEDDVQAVDKESNDNYNTNEEKKISKDKVVEMRKNILSRYAKGKVNSHWKAMALSKDKDNKKFAEEYCKELIVEIKNNEKNCGNKVTDVEKDIILLNLLGYDVTNIEGINLLDILMNSNIEGQGANGLIYAIIAIDSVNEDNIKNYFNNAHEEKDLTKLVEMLLQYQNEDGGFSLVKGKESDIDITSMAIQALAIHTQNENCDNNKEENLKISINKAFKYLENAKLENAESIAQIILALQFSDEKDYNFNIENLVDKLLEYYCDEVGFSHEISGEPDEIATEQGVLALTSYMGISKEEINIYENHNKVDQNVENNIKANGDKKSYSLPIAGGVGILIIVVIGVWIALKKKKMVR